MQNKVFIRNLSFQCADGDLRDLFSQFGVVTSATVALDRDTGHNRGFGFVEMLNQQQAEAAIRGLKGREFGGRTLHIAMAEKGKSPKNNGRRR